MKPRAAGLAQAHTQVKKKLTFLSLIFFQKLLSFYASYNRDIVYISNKIFLIYCVLVVTEIPRFPPWMHTVIEPIVDVTIIYIQIKLIELYSLRLISTVDRKWPNH